MDLTQAIDIYCERLGPGLLAEPLNAVTNLAFFLAAWFGLGRARREAKTEPATWALIGLIVAIGIGSTLFHTFAQRWAAIADTTPISLFIVVYFGLTMRRMFGTTTAEAVVLSVAFLFFAAGLGRAAGVALPEVLARSAGYYPALVSLLTCGALLAARRRPAGWWLIGVGGVFVVSLTFRSLDMPLCAQWPYGTHFMWHVMNSVVLGMAVWVWLRYGARRREPAGAPA